MDGPLGSESAWTLDFLAGMQLVSACERSQVSNVLAEASLAACLDFAETIHLHIKIDDTDRLASRALEAAGGSLDHGAPGFVKYRMPGRVNAIFSHIPVAADDLRECKANRRPRPFLDHIGIDVRVADAHSRAAFDALPARAAAIGWVHVAQGANDGVRCCHTVVDRKHWLFPAVKGMRPIEVAFGPLRAGPGAPGCDLRPSHPALGLQDGCCA
jgi:hypothetical protein